MYAGTSLRRTEHRQVSIVATELLLRILCFIAEGSWRHLATLIRSSGYDSRVNTVLETKPNHCTFQNNMNFVNGGADGSPSKVKAARDAAQSMLRSTLSPTKQTAAATTSLESTFSSLFIDEVSAPLAQESEDGNVEYKRCLVNPSTERLQHLTTQMHYRLTEGEGECIYQIGFDDNGDAIGISEDAMSASLHTLDTMAARLNATTKLLRLRAGTSEASRTAEVLVRLLPTELHGSIELRVAVVGNVDSGKSTLIGVLTKGSLDNGRGSARSHCFRHKHEVDSGRTSSVSHGCMGFDPDGGVTNYNPESLRANSMADVMGKSTKLVNFIDLAGHERYLKTTVFGLTGNMPDYSMIMLGANMGVQKMTKEHLGLTLSLQIPFFVCITKVDIAPKEVRVDTIKRMRAILKSKGVKKLPYMMKTEDDVVNCAKNMSQHTRLVPMIQVSNVTGQGLDLLRLFLNLLPSKQEWQRASHDEGVEFWIDDHFQITGVGVVVSGNMFKGSLAAGTKTATQLMLGPDEFGKFRPVIMKSIHTRGIPVARVQAGMSASFAVKAVPGTKEGKVERSNIRKGMVLVDAKSNPRSAYMFEANVLVLHHPTTIQAGYQPVVHLRTARQSAWVVDMDKPLLRSGDAATVKFRFAYRPEFVKEGLSIVFREGTTKGQGVVTRVIYEDEDEAKSFLLRKHSP